MTPSRIAELRVLAGAATPGPWEWDNDDERGGWRWAKLTTDTGAGLIVGARGVQGRCTPGTGPEPLLRAHCALAPSALRECVDVHVLGTDARYIAAACNELPAALDEIERLRAAVDRVNDLLGAHGCECDCNHSYDEHDDACERCFPCRIDAALKGSE